MELKNMEEKITSLEKNLIGVAERLNILAKTFADFLENKDGQIVKHGDSDTQNYKQKSPNVKQDTPWMQYKPYSDDGCKKKVKDTNIFNPGDKVRLKSGGPLMTVGNFQRLVNGYSYYCKYFQYNVNQEWLCDEGSFPEETLEKA